MGGWAGRVGKEAAPDHLNRIFFYRLILSIHLMILSLGEINRHKFGPLCALLLKINLTLLQNVGYECLQRSYKKSCSKIVPAWVLILLLKAEEVSSLPLLELQLNLIPFDNFCPRNIKNWRIHLPSEAYVH